ncbi:MAG: UUP1 family membrane protein, partial [Moritella sp.]|uniref:UUP1 family membrane protein n=1 Tax=Moritella sp. TaxID=78556 RepID=UPI001D2BDD50
MPSKIQFRIFVAVLFLLGVGSIAQRHYSGEIPWFPGDTYSTWMIEAKVEFTAQGDAVNASFAT